MKLCRTKARYLRGVARQWEDRRLSGSPKNLMGPGHYGNQIPAGIITLNLVRERGDTIYGNGMEFASLRW